MPKSYLAIETDTHGGHRHGLCNPETILYEEDQEGNILERNPNMTATQQYLWDLRVNNIAALTTKANGERIDYLHAGDQTQGNKYMSEVYSTVMSDQIAIAYANMWPILDIPNVANARFVKGTQSHEYGEGTTGNMLQTLYTQKYPDKNIRHTWHSLLNINGLTVDLAHHGPFPGSRAWLKGNVARYYLRDKMYADLLAHKEPARLYIRGHYHEEVWETLRIKTNGKWHISTLIVVPSMCGMGVYARQATRSSHKISNGMVIVEHDEGRIVDMDWLVKTLDIRTKEVL